jgi:hypothetical protein
VFNWLWRWFGWDAGAPSEWEARHVPLKGSVGTHMPLWGSVGTAMLLEGGVGTHIPLWGAQTVAIYQTWGCFRGEDVLLTDTLRPPGGITGWAITFTLKKLYTDQTVLITKTVGNGISIIDPINGVFTVGLSALDTNLPAGDYLYTIARTDTGAHTVLTYGPVKILDDTVF